MESVWNSTTDCGKFPRQESDIKTDVLIIGGGMAGVLSAYMLQQSGVDYTLIEAERLCGGITANTTAKITFQHGLLYHKLIKRFGIDTAQLYLNSQKRAIEKLRDICQSVSCDFEECSSFVYSLNSRAKIEREVEALNQIGCDAEFEESLSLPFNVAGAVKVGEQAQFNPLKFVFAISEKLNIYENTKALELMPDYLLTNRGKIRAKKIIVATHFPFMNKHGGYFIKMYQHRSYVIAFENGADVNGIYVDEADKGMSFRNYKNMLLIGGGGHRTGKQGGNWKEITAFAKKYYPKAQEKYRWATQDCMTLDGVPYIGQYSGSTPDLYVATGFNKWGMSSSMAAAMLLSDLVQGRENSFASVYSPQRSIFHPQMALNMTETLVNFLTPTTPRCPHLGCALKYNPQEHSWDCPCHGSRFTKEGKLIDNPATDSKEM